MGWCEKPLGPPLSGQGPWGLKPSKGVDIDRSGANLGRALGDNDFLWTDGPA